MTPFAITTTPHRIRFVAVIATIAATVLLMFAGFAHRAHAETQVRAADEHIITVHDDGVDKGFITKKSTLRAALEEANIPLDPKDRTEPGLDDTLIANSYQVNIYRARSVVVRDGSNQYTVITSYRTGKQIAKDAGLTLHDQDRVSLSTSSNIARDGAPEVLTVQRATPLTFMFYGKSLEVHTFAKTVGDMLKQRGITLAANDVVRPGLATPIVAGMKVELWRDGKQTVVVEEEVAFAVDEVKDADLDVGKRETITPGEKGKRMATYEVTTQNGIEVARVEVSSTVTKQPVKQVDKVGAKFRGSYTTPSQNQTITWNFLIAKGLTREQTAGIMGNLMQEHGFNTTGDGLAQWTGGRKANLLAMPDPYSIDTQLNFLWQELSGPYAKVLTNIRAQSTVEGATVVFQNQYERCGICAEGKRIQYAYNILASF